MSKKCFGTGLFIHILILTSNCSARTASDKDTSTANDVTLAESDTLSKNKVSDSDKIHKQLHTSAMQALMEAYPAFISDIKDNKILFCDGSSMTYDDGKIKDFDTLLDNSDPEDMFFVRYTSQELPPEYLADAGRSRCEELFRKMYGNSSAEVQKHLVNVNWFGKNIKFTSVNGAADRLKEVEKELRKHPELESWMDCSGTFYWRQVRGAKRLSAHSYGIAIDIAVKNSDYWLWKYPKAGETAKIGYANRIPNEIVDIFERYGFIWGGAWYHFDTMHFEYRPEILKFSQYTASNTEYINK